MALFIQFESFLINHNVMSDTFKELSNKPTNRSNIKRLLTLVFQMLMMIRFVISVVLDLALNRITFDESAGQTWSILGRSLANFMRCICILLGTLAIAFVLTVSYCERSGHFGFLYDLHPDNQTEGSDYSNLLVSKRFKLILRLRLFATFILPFICCPLVGGFATFEIFRQNSSVFQLMYNMVWIAFESFYLKHYNVVLYSVGLICYLITNKVRCDLKRLRIATSNGLVDQSRLFLLTRRLADIMTKISKYNQFVKYILCAINMFSVPAVGLACCLFNLEHENKVIQFIVYVGCFYILITMALSALVMSSIYHQVLTWILIFYVAI